MNSLKEGGGGEESEKAASIHGNVTDNRMFAKARFVNRRSPLLLTWIEKR